MAKAKQYGAAVQAALAMPQPGPKHWLDKITPQQLKWAEELRREYQHGQLVGRSVDQMLQAVRSTGVKVGKTAFAPWLREPVERPDAT